MAPPAQGAHLVPALGLDPAAFGEVEQDFLLGPDVMGVIRAAPALDEPNLIDVEFHTPIITLMSRRRNG